MCAAADLALRGTADAIVTAPLSKAALHLAGLNYPGHTEILAERCGVQASTIVRFAKAFGYDGASQMQRLFRNELINSAPSPSYSERIRQFNQQSGDGPGAARSVARIR